MPVPTAQRCYMKWIRHIPTIMNILGGNTRPDLFNVDAVQGHATNAGRFVNPNIQDAWQLALQGKIAIREYSSTHGRQDQITSILERFTNHPNAQETWERDVAMWYGYCRESSRGAKMCRRLFSIIKQAGVYYRKANNTWGCFGSDFPDVPVASLLSHGDRILILLPPSYQQHKLKAIGRTLKGLTVDPLKATFWKGSYHTFRMTENRAAHGAGTAVYRLSGLAALSELLPAVVGAKAYEAGDDTIFDWVRVWKFYKGENLHTRMAATHNTSYQGTDEPMNYHQRMLWYVEQKPGGARNMKDSFLGRHYFKNVALGGNGNINPFSGVKINSHGGHGHLYINYRAPTALTQGCILVGCEGSAPAVPDQTGKAHDSKGTKGRFSPTGGKKWNELMPNTFFGMPDKDTDPVGYKAAKKNVTKFVCDLSERATQTALRFVSRAELGADDLHQSVNRCAPADWTDQIRLIEKSMDVKQVLKRFFGGTTK